MQFLQVFLAVIGAYALEPAAQQPKAGPAGDAEVKGEAASAEGGDGENVPGSEAGDPEAKPDYSDVEITMDANGVLFAKHLDKRAQGVLHFLLERGLASESYEPAARVIADQGWQVYIYGGDPEIGVLDEKYSKDACVVIGGLGDIGAEVFQYGFERRHDGVDGGIVVATIFNDIEEYKGKFSAATIVASEDAIVTPEAVANQARVYPSQSYYLTINGGNHAGFYPGQSFERDGAAEFDAEEQLDTLGQILRGRMSRFCQTREKRIAEAARKAAREAARDKNEN